MNANPETPDPALAREPHAGSRDGASFAHRDQGGTAPPEAASTIATALAWVEENPTLALLGAFALGVFIGTMMRD